MKGKLPQKKAGTRRRRTDTVPTETRSAWLPDYVKEIYHPDYVAKRMEIGAVMGAAPRPCGDPRRLLIRGISSSCWADVPDATDCGGATGSSKVHTEESIEACGAEVQKGNPPTERKIQRLFRREEVSCLIKKCNDFGAGGVSVAIGELADGLRVDLDQGAEEICRSGRHGDRYLRVPGADGGGGGSQRCGSSSWHMPGEENLEATEVAVVTEAPRLVLVLEGQEHRESISRAFLDTNGAHQETEVAVEIPKPRRTAILLGRVEVEDVRAEMAWHL